MTRQPRSFSFRSLHLSLRFVIPLVVALALLAYAVVPLFDDLTLRCFARDLNMRSRLISSTLQEPLAELLQRGERGRINALLQMIEHSGCSTALFIGDDETDEDIFRLDDRRIFTICVGTQRPTAAAYYLQDQVAITQALQLMISYLRRK